MSQKGHRRRGASWSSSNTRDPRSRVALQRELMSAGRPSFTTSPCVLATWRPTPHRPPTVNTVSTRLCCASRCFVLLYRNPWLHDLTAHWLIKLAARPVVSMPVASDGRRCRVIFYAAVRFRWDVYLDSSWREDGFFDFLDICNSIFYFSPFFSLFWLYQFAEFSRMIRWRVKILEKRDEIKFWEILK